MKGWGAVLLLSAALGGLWWSFKSSRSQPQSSPPALEATAANLQAQSPNVIASPEAPSPENTTAELPGPVLPLPKAKSLAAMEEFPGPVENGDVAALPPATALENMRATIRQYTLRFGENPVGDNAEITQALTGKNPKQVRFLNDEDGFHVNSKGQLIDHWGTPYFFHQLSRTEMEIRSAGPDHKMWTADDLAMK